MASNPSQPPFLRRLAVAQNPTEPSTDSTQSSASAPSPRPRSASSRNVTTACLACKQRKSKCSTESAGVPCDACRARSTECIYDETSDQRRKLFAKQNLQELHQKRKLLDDLIVVLRDGDDSQLQHLLQVIRANASPEEIAVTVEELLTQVQSHDEMSGVQGSESRRVDARELEGHLMSVSANIGPEESSQQSSS